MRLTLLIAICLLFIVACQDEQDIKYNWKVYHFQVTTQGASQTKYQNEFIVKDKSELEMEVKYQDRYEYYDQPYKITIAHLYSWVKI